MAEMTIEIARTPEEVFDYLTDVANLPRWQSGVHSATREGETIHERAKFLKLDRGDRSPQPVAGVAGWSGADVIDRHLAVYDLLGL